MSSRVCFCDTETTGLDPDHHDIWEVALIDEAGAEYEWTLPVDISRADSKALEISRFHSRYWTNMRTPLEHFAIDFRKLTDGCHLAGAVISFDEERLRKLLRANGECPMWHYHLVDVEALAAGSLGAAPPWNSDDLSRRVGVNPDDFDRHSALGDARWAKAIYDVVVGFAGEAKP